MAQMTDDTLRRLLDQEIQQSVTWASETIREEQARNLAYYLGYPMGNEVSGRSQVVSWDVFEVIEQAMPDLIEPFFNSDTIGEFKPKGPEDEPFASQATDYINHVLKERNPAFTIFETWIKDGLMSKVGVVRAEWVPGEKRRLDLVGLSGEQLTMLAEDPHTEIIEHTERPDEQAQAMLAAQIQQMQAAGQPLPAQMPPPPMLHDVTILQQQAGCIEVENVRPENFIISRGTTTTERSKVIGEYVRYTRSDLKEMGFRNYADVQDFEESLLGQSDALDALRDDGGTDILRTDGVDPAMEEVKLFKGFIRADVDGDGVAEWRRVLVGSGEDPFLENEPAEWHNYAVWTPIKIPHRVIGMAYADPAAEIQKIKTALTRNYLDSLYMANRPKTYINTAAGVNIEDVLSEKIGGIIRGTAPFNQAIQPIQTALVSRDALEGLVMADQMRESRIGLPKINPEQDSTALNTTATGVRSVDRRTYKRLKMTLRAFAETGVKSLLRLLLRLTTQYQDRAASIRLRNQWVQFDPRQWNPEMDVTVEAGIGAADDVEQLAALQQFGQFMAWAQQVGVVQPANIHQFGVRLAKHAKIKGAEAELVTDPKTLPPAQPQPPVEVLVEQARGQTQLQVEQLRAQLKMREQQGALQLQASNDMRDAAREDAKATKEFQLEEQRMGLDGWKTLQDNQTRLQVAMIQQQGKAMSDAASAAAGAAGLTGEGADVADAADVRAQGMTQDQMNMIGMALEAMSQQIVQLGELIRKPKRLVRGPDGRVTGAEIQE